MNVKSTLICLCEAISKQAMKTMFNLIFLKLHFCLLLPMSLITVLGGIDLQINRCALCPRTEYSLESETITSIIRFIPHFPGFKRDRRTPRSRNIAGRIEKNLLRLRKFHSIDFTVHSDISVATAAR